MMKDDATKTVKTLKVPNVQHNHVERVIQKLKTFKILSQAIPISTLRACGFDDAAQLIICKDHYHIM